MFTPRSKLRRAMIAADAARDRSDWSSAVQLYAHLLTLRPDRAAVWVQYGHARKESGDLAGAEQAYLRALQLEPRNTDTLMNLGHVRKTQGRFGAAIEAYAEALRLDPVLRSARDELLRLGGRAALPGGEVDGLRRAVDLADLRRGLDAAAAAVAEWEIAGPRPVRDYDAFRRDYPLPPPPERTAGSIHVRIDATDAPAALVRLSLLSLLDQHHADWRAVVLGPDALAEHPLGSLARIDARITFDEETTSAPDALVLAMPAGTLLAPEALAWLAFAAARTGAAGVFADHDHALPEWRHGPAFFGPRLYPMFDQNFFAAVDEPPLIVLARREIVAAVEPREGAEHRRAVLLHAARHGSIAHLPRILSSRTELPELAWSAPDDLPAACPASPPAPAAQARGPQTISVVIPTRDAPEMLRTAVESLRATANAPGLLDIVIVDNRSVEPSTSALLKRWEGDGTARRLGFDEPFNWSRANNTGVREARGDLIVFANNDVEMLTPDWDQRLVASLQREDVGAVGARLLYPDRTVQHAGILFGMGRGSPIHEGVGAASDDAGPLGRWKTRRAAAAVTGAFLAVTRTSWRAVDGFDELLAIGFNDVDFCLRLRRSGRLVLYEPAIELIHQESKTRGLNDTMSKVAWDLGELESFHRRWGEAMLHDPGYNPHWSTAGLPFDGLREPSVRIILEHLDRSASPLPWAVA